MSPIAFLRERFKAFGGDAAFIWKDQVFSYTRLLESVDRWRSRLDSWGLIPGQVVFLRADFTPEAAALFLALAEARAILVPTTEAASAETEERASVSQCEIRIDLGADDVPRLVKNSTTANHELYRKLREANRAGLVLFSSGSGGKPKAVVHDLESLLEKFKVVRHRRRTLLFLLFDHIGGINTMLYTLSNGGGLVPVADRRPENVLSLIEKHSVETLPTTPTFLNMILLSGAYERYPLQSLKLVTYGTEPMPESTLKKFHVTYPHIELLQTYGLSELGILRSKSKSSDSLWVKVGGEGFETRVVEGLLQVKARSAMLGYLNAPSPFTEDGWFMTGDAVETDGEYLRILGRKSGWINVGGQKVNPVEVESVIREMPEVADVTVTAGKNYLLGSYVSATVTPKELKEEPAVFAKRLKRFCAGRLEAYKVPVKVEFASEEPQVTARFKKERNSHA